MNLITLNNLFEKFNTYDNAEDWINNFKGLIGKLTGEFYLFYSPEHFCLEIEYIFKDIDLTIEIFKNKTIICTTVKNTSRSNME